MIFGFWLAGFVALFFLGHFCALPALIPVLRNRARQSRLMRRILIGTLSSASFVLFVMLFALLSAIFVYPLEAGYSYGNDNVQDSKLDRELLLHFLVPPVILPNDTCFADDEYICEISEYLLNDNHTMLGYIIKLLLSLIPAYSCSVYAWYFTKDNRKEKLKL